ncbi:hypothetical protein [Desulfothermobacter acidiphilus]|uniref:hypothetical protein n=1 Tax=Desulfothermobacter acidiphilus TaxID=1938353 RepID=UPI003F896D89
MQGKGRKSGERLRHFDVRLRADHPIFRVPAGKRAEVARWLLSPAELYLGLLNELKELKERVSRLEGLLAEQPSLPRQDMRQEKKPDPREFLSAFGGWEE